MKASVDATDMKRLADHFKRVAKAWDKMGGVTVKCRGTGERSAEENAEIFMREADKGRDPLFMDRQERGKALTLLEKVAVKAVEAWTNTDTRPMERAAEAIGKMMVGWIKEHIRQGKSEDGRMRPLADAVQKYKDRHFPGKSILERTGQLLGSLYAEVRRG